jgi:hypothetical protein
MLKIELKTKEKTMSNTVKKTNIRGIQKAVIGVLKLVNENAKKPTTEIFEYIRRRKGGKSVKSGVVFGILDNEGTIRIGWSKCNIKEDKFNPVDGVALAKHRALGAKKSPAVPLCLRNQLRKFGSRAIRYFKNASKLETPV